MLHPEDQSPLPDVPPAARVRAWLRHALADHARTAAYRPDRRDAHAAPLAVAPGEAGT
jgi:hypothetical protein